MMEINTEAAVLYPRVDVRGAADIIKNAKNTLILCHINPDGDCIGSSFALSGLIKAFGNNARVACADSLPHRLRFLAGEQDELTAGDVAEYDSIISVDVASPAQLGDYAALIPQISLMIDHHAVGEVFAPCLIDPTAAAAGEIIYEIYKTLRDEGALGRLDGVARDIYAAVASDTGSFKYSNTTPRTHRIAAELLGEINSSEDGGGDTCDICRRLFGQRRLSELVAQMLAIQNLKLYENGALSAVTFTREMLDIHGLTDEDIGNAVEVPRGVEGVLVGIAIRPLSQPGMYKVSSRANADIDLSAVCSAYGGGGHVRAAGCTVRADSVYEALEVMKEAFGTAVRKYTESIKDNK